MPVKKSNQIIASAPIPIPESMTPPVLERQTTNSIVGKPKKQNNWIDHVKATATKDGISYRQALSVAKATYKKD
jgi:hypothetical protein